MKRIRLFDKLFISHAAVAIVTLIFVTVGFSRLAEFALYRQTVRDLASLGKELAASRVWFERVPDVFLYGADAVLRGRQIGVAWVDGQGRVVRAFGWNAPAMRRHSMAPVPADEWDVLHEGRPVHRMRQRDRFPEPVTLVVVPLRTGNRFDGAILLASPVAGQELLLRLLNRTALTAAGAALVAALVASGVLAYSFGRRIARLRRFVSHIRDGDFHFAVPVTSGDELGELARDFNAMAQQLADSRAELEELEERRRQFVADVSHELRTPLTSIRGVVEGMRRGLVAPEEQEKYLALIERETLRLIRLVSELLDLENLRAGRVMLKKVRLSLEEMLEIVKDHGEPLAREKGLAFDVRVEHGVEVCADYDRLLQILLNLVTNALRFTERGRVCVRGYRDGEHVVMEVEDTGVGMTPEELKGIWERFARSRSSGGSGLGLAIARELVALHGGTITAESEKGKGTRFVVRLPDA